MRYALAAILMGWLAWVFVIMVAGLGAVGACAALYDNLGALLERFRPKRRNERG